MSPPRVEVITNPIVPSGSIVHTSLKTLSSPATSATSFSLSQLLQWTNNFSEENLTRVGRSGKVYIAECPGRKV